MKHKQYNLRKLYEDGKGICEGYNGFPSICPECRGALADNSDFDYASQWTASYTCEACSLKFAYQPSDMGQTIPWFVKYDDKDTLFN